MFTTRLVNHVRLFRTRLNFTQEQLAAATGVSRQTIIAIEKGGYVPSTELALRLARALREPVELVFQLPVEGPDNAD